MEKFTFTLGGREHEATRADVEGVASSLAPKEASKYIVEVNGRRFPPKQLVAEVLGVPLVAFTTMDANRILRGLGYEIAAIDRLKAVADKTESESLFQDYLNAGGLIDFEFEAPIPGHSQRPDFVLHAGGTRVFLEIKEFRATPDDFKPGGGAYDPYRPIREKIDAGRRKFHGLRDQCCCLVLYNAGKPLVDLGWRFVYAAMLGNLAYRFPLDLARGEIIDTNAENVFSGGGKMLRYAQGNAIATQNTTVSAILVLEQLPLGKIRFDADVRQEEARLGRNLSLEEFMERIEMSRGTASDISLRQLRVVVNENPYAAMKLSRSVFNGPFDERYGPKEGQIDRIVAGNGIEALEVEINQGAQASGSSQGGPVSSLIAASERRRSVP